MNPTAALMLTKSIEEERRRSAHPRRNGVARETGTRRIPRISLADLFRLRRLDLDRPKG